MNNKSQPGTASYVQPTVNAQGDPFRTISAQYGQEANVFGALDDRATKQKIDSIAREALKSFENIAKESDALTQRLQKNIDSMAAFKKEVNLSGEALKEHNQHNKELQKALDKILNIESAINQEMKKTAPDEKKILDLKLKQVEAQANAEKVASKTRNQKQLEIQLMEKHNALQEGGLDTAERIQKANEEILDIKKDMYNTETNINNQYAESLELLEQYKKKIEENKKALKGAVATFRDSISQMIQGFEDILDATDMSKRIERWTMQLDEFTKETYTLANSWGTDYSSSFQSFRTSLMKEINDGNAFNSEQLSTAMHDLTQYSFESFSTLKGMARDLTFAKEYMGMQNDTLVDLYGMQLRSNDDTFIKKTLSTVVSLQKSGLQVSEDQLNATVKSSMTLTDAMVASGMSYDAMSNFQQSLTELMVAADATLGTGGGERVKSQLESILKGGINSVAELGPTAVNGYLSALQTGDAFALWNSVNSSEAANVYKGLYNQGPSVATMMLGSGELNFGGLDPGLIRDYDQNQSDANRINENLKESLREQTEVEQHINEIIERLPEAYKESNKINEAMLATDYALLSEQKTNRDFYKSLKDEITTDLKGLTGVIKIITGVIAALQSVSLMSNTMALNANTAALGGNTITSFLGGSGKGLIGKLFGGGSTLGGTQGVSLTSWGNGALAKAAPLAIAAGTMWTAVDGFSGGLNGLQNSQGETIADAGFGTGLASAVSGTKVYDNWGDNVGMGALGGAAKGAMIGAFGGPLGMAIGGGIGAIVGAIGGWWKDSKNKAAKEEADRKKELELEEDLTNLSRTNVEQLSALRSAVLQNRYLDYRNGPSGAVGSPHSEIRSAVGGGTKGGKEDPYRGGSPKTGKLSAHDASADNKSYNGVSLGPFSFTSRYGWRNYKGITWHSGIDFSKYQDITQPIGAAFDGEVTDLVTGNDPYGSKANYVAIYHPTQGVTGLYYHLAKAADGLSVGDPVKAGNIIGYQGSSGESTGPHLHYQVNRGEGIKWGQDVDPGNYISTGIFSPGGPVTGVSTSEEDGSYASMKTRDVTAVMPGATPGISTGAVGNTPSHGDIKEFRSSSIEGKLDILNKTLLGMQAKQDKQEEIIKALTNTPIYDYGV